MSRDMILTSETVKISDRKVFLLTNSPYHFTDVVMKYLLDDLTGKKWTDYFDYIIVKACKPRFFNEGTPFRFILLIISTCFFQKACLTSIYLDFLSPGKKNFIFLITLIILTNISYILSCQNLILLTKMLSLIFS